MQLFEEAEKLRDALFAELDTFCVRDWRARKRRRRAGDEWDAVNDLAQDLLTQAELLRQCRTSDGPETVTTADMGRAEVLGEHLFRFVGEMRYGLPEQTALDRERAFSLLAHAYEATRRAIARVRAAEGDGETLAPPLVQARGD